jgi:hypothetical protein
LFVAAVLAVLATNNNTAFHMRGRTRVSDAAQRNTHDHNYQFVHPNTPRKFRIQFARRIRFNSSEFRQIHVVAAFFYHSPVRLATAGGSERVVLQEFRGT